MLLSVLFNSLTLSLQLLMSSLVIKLNLGVSILKVSKLFVLDLSFILEALVLSLNVTLDFRDVLFGLEKSILTELFEELSILSVNSLLLSL